MPGGKFTLTYGGRTIDFGHVTHFGPTYIKQCSTTPLPSLPMEATFAVETSSGLDVQISFTHTGSNNAGWYGDLQAAVNRWQCETNGFVMNFIPDSDTPYLPEMRNLNGYIKSISLQYNKADPMIIKGTMEFHVGTMYVTNNPGSFSSARPQSDYQIFLSSGSGAPCLILGTDSSGNRISCVESYTFTGGLEQPFEYITLKIPKKKLSQMYPILAQEGGIVAGKSTLRLSAVGQAEMTVTKCRLSGNTYTVTAYANSEKLRGYSTSGRMSYTPEYWIDYIISSGQFGIAYSGENYVKSYTTSVSDAITFEAGTNVWYILQVCAMLQGARVFFSEGKAYVVDYRQASDAIEGWDDELDLYGSSNMQERVAGSTELGDEGVDTIVNSQVIRFTEEVENDSGEIVKQSVNSDPYKDEGSIRVFGEKQGNVISIPEFVKKSEFTVSFFDEDGSAISSLTQTIKEGDTVNTSPLLDWLNSNKVNEETHPEEFTDPSEFWTTFDFAQEITQGYNVYPNSDEGTGNGNTLVDAFANNYISYRAEPQQSIAFTVKEMGSKNGEPAWQAYFSPCASASRIYDAVNETEITNASDIESSRTPVLQKLTLSQYERHYPQGTTTYTWGVMANIDLSSSTSQINTSLNNM